jgi:hypothetical protein
MSRSPSARAPVGTPPPRRTRRPPPPHSCSQCNLALSWAASEAAPGTWRRTPTCSYGLSSSRSAPPPLLQSPPGPAPVGRTPPRTAPARRCPGGSHRPRGSQPSRRAVEDNHSNRVQSTTGPESECSYIRRSRSASVESLFLNNPPTKSSAAAVSSNKSASQGQANIARHVIDTYWDPRVMS